MRRRVRRATAATRRRSIWNRCSIRTISSCCKDWIYRHFEATGSPRAKWILENWAAMLPKFVKVFPHEFKRVMKKQRPQARDRHACRDRDAGGMRGRCVHG